MHKAQKLTLLGTRYTYLVWDHIRTPLADVKKERKSKEREITIQDKVQTGKGEKKVLNRTGKRNSTTTWINSYKVNC